jgi:glucose/mannose transport system substrate-binding protein
MLGGEPPDSFQVWAGVGVVEDHVVPGRMEGLDFLYSEEGLYDVFPQSVIDNVSYEGTPYVVPVNIHRQNIMWYRLDRFEAAGITEPPTTWDEFFIVAEQLKEAGIPAIGGASLGALAFHTYNYFLNGVTDGETYLGLFDGSVGWDAPEVAEALELHRRAMEYASDDWLEVGWGDQVERFAADYDETPAIILMGDWFWGFIKSEGIEEMVGWADIPNHQGKYVWVADSFGLPKDAPNRENAIAWLKVVASRAGQDAFNPLKGSIPVRTDGDASLYDEYLTESMEAWDSLELLPFIGGLVRQSFVTDLGNVVNNYTTGHGDVVRAQEELIEAAADSGIGE